jgi:hypothetical protein
MQPLKLAALFILVTAATACKKNPVSPKPETTSKDTPHPAMTYIDLSGKSIAYGQSLTLDLNKDGKLDLQFYTAQISYDDNTKAKKVYYVASFVYCNVATNLDNDFAPIYTKGTPITRSNLPGYEWNNAQLLDLAHKVYSGGATYWEGPWKNQDHQYLPLQILSGTKTYMGWVELGADTQQEKLVFYKAAICQEPDVTIKAGI